MKLTTSEMNYERIDSGRNELGAFISYNVKTRINVFNKSTKLLIACESKIKMLSQFS